MAERDYINEEIRIGNNGSSIGRNSVKAICDRLQGQLRFDQLPSSSSATASSSKPITAPKPKITARSSSDFQSRQARPSLPPRLHSMATQNVIHPQDAQRILDRVSINTNSSSYTTSRTGSTNGTISLNDDNNNSSISNDSSIASTTTTTTSQHHPHRYVDDIHQSLISELRARTSTTTPQQNTTTEIKQHQTSPSLDMLPTDVGIIRPISKKGRQSTTATQHNESNTDLQSQLSSSSTVNSDQVASYSGSSWYSSIVSEHDSGNSSSNNESNTIDSKDLKRKRQLGCVAMEFYSVEKTFTELLYNLTETYPQYLQNYSKQHLGDIANDNDNDDNNGSKILKTIRDYLTPIYEFHKVLLDEFEHKITNWNSDNPNIADVLLRHGDFLQICNPFLSEKKRLCNDLLKLLNENKQLAIATNQFEEKILARIPVVQQLDTVHQNVVRYKILLESYHKYLIPQSDEAIITKKAIDKLNIVSAKVNSLVADADSSRRLIDLQRRLQPDKFNVFLPGRKLICESDMRKQSRKVSQHRYLILFSDKLLICRRNELIASEQFDKKMYMIPVETIKAEVGRHDEFDCEFVIISPHRSSTFIAKDRRERDYWVEKLQTTANEAEKRRRERKKASRCVSSTNAADDDNFASTAVSDEWAAPWLADKMSTTCLMADCRTEFNFVHRRHHCRVCGWLICERCVGYAPSKKFDFKKVIVCPECFHDIQQSFENGQLFPESMIVRDVGTTNTTQKVLVKLNGNLIVPQKLFKISKSGKLKKTPLPDRCGDNYVFGMVFVRSKATTATSSNEQQKWGRLTDGMKLQFYNAQFDKDPYYSQVLFGFELTSTEVDDGRIFNLRHRNQVQTERNETVISFRVPQSAADTWNNALSAGLIEL